ncbi:MAG: hypothetical protein M1431_03530 [Candidatus Thermoplasmatota archaeon]|nr:hypothetical protein [Candidatus Thermoplasmatota archaeon]
MSDSEPFKVSIISEGIDEHFGDKIAKALNSLDSNLMVSLLAGNGAEELENLMHNSVLILIKKASLRLEALKKRVSGKAVILINPEISSVLKGKLYLLNNRVLVISCKEDDYFDSASTSFHDLISGSAMKIMHNCNESNLPRKVESIARITKKFLEEAEL